MLRLLNPFEIIADDVCAPTLPLVLVHKLKLALVLVRSEIVAGHLQVAVHCTVSNDALAAGSKASSLVP